MNRYIYTYVRELYGVRLDTFYHVQSPYIPDPTAAQVAFRINPNLMDEDLHHIHHILLRCRFQAAEGPFMVKTEFDLTRDDLQLVLTDAYNARRLHEVTGKRLFK